MNAIYLDLSTTFDVVSHNIQVSKRSKAGLKIQQLNVKLGGKYQVSDY